MDQTTNESNPNPPARRGKVWIKRILRLSIFAVTAAAVGYHVVQASKEIRADELTLDGRWLAASVAAYVIGLAVLGLPWTLLLRDYGAQVSHGAALRVYLISHLGKYVPGKAMPILIRCTMLGPRGVAVAVLAITSFYETFCTMASGSFLAGLCLTLAPLPTPFVEAFAARPLAGWIVLGLVAGFGAAVVPPLFQLFSKMITLPFKDARSVADRRASAWTVVASLLLGLAAWSILGVGYWSTLNAVASHKLGVDALPMAACCVALSIVLGFVSMLPGQAGVREWILIEALLPVVGRPVAVAASLLFRLVSLLSEAALAAGLYWGGGGRR